MKKTFHYLLATSIFIGLAFSSCGPSKKLVDSRANVNKLQKENTAMNKKLIDCSSEVSVLQDERTALQNENLIAEEDYKTLSAESKMTIAGQQSRLKYLQNIIQSQQDVMTNLKNSISEALKLYKPDELYVYVKDGKVYVSLEEKLLFKSGSSSIDPKGKEALQTLAKVLNNTKDISVMIEGHTDNVPIKTAQFKDNWDLSTARATSIVRILTKDYGFDSNRITASGRGKYQPIKTNETEAGRAGNRRTEVILSPDLQEVFDLLYTSN
jgi:chemotaxis protein MotB